MLFGLQFVTLSGLLAATASAAKGSADVKACVWLTNPPSRNFTVNWTAGGSNDRCMTETGESVTAKVYQKGLSCANLGRVSLDRSWGCYVRASMWELSYNAVEVAYSGTAVTQWSDGPYNSDVTIVKGAGVYACGSKALCSDYKVEWDNDYWRSIYIIFKPGTYAFNSQDLK